MARAALPLWQRGTVGALYSLLAAAALLLESVLYMVCSGLAQLMVCVREKGRVGESEKGRAREQEREKERERERESCV
jgi:hypothetical protein